MCLWSPLTECRALSIALGFFDRIKGSSLRIQGSFDRTQGSVDRIWEFRDCHSHQHPSSNHIPPEHPDVYEREAGGWRRRGGG